MTDYKLVPVDLLSELAESLASELDARYPASVRSYESQDRKYQAEMEPVLTARQIIAAAPAVQGEPLFRFNARAVESDPTGYYMTRWDRAQPVTVVAHTRDEAFEKVRTMMGDPTRHGAWAVRIDSAEEIVNDNQ